ncbi:MAG: site-specific integrase [Magnetococcales bacterium]|nr:site-specific integrase [Magnetococcales bacterium]
MPTKQANILSPATEEVVLRHLTTTRYPTRNRVLFLLSIKAGMRSQEIAVLKWSMVMDADGRIGDCIRLVNATSHGRRSGREIPLHKELKAALLALQAERGDQARPEREVIQSERGDRMSAITVTNWFFKLYQTLGLEGFSSHSGRRSFATRTVQAVVEGGGSLKDVQELMGHASLAMTQKYMPDTLSPSRAAVVAPTGGQSVPHGERVERVWPTPPVETAASTGGQSMPHGERVERVMPTPPEETAAATGGHVPHGACPTPPVDTAAPTSGQSVSCGERVERVIPILPVEILAPPTGQGAQAKAQTVVVRVESLGAGVTHLLSDMGRAIWGFRGKKGSGKIS